MKAPRRALSWARSVLGRGARIERSVSLTGGITGRVTALDAIDAERKRLRLVLKLYRPDPEELDSARREAHVLMLLADSGLPVPRMIAVDPEGAECGWPALLMTRMPGSRRMRPRDLAPWLHELAQLAARIHATPIPSSELSPYEPWGLEDPLPVPRWWSDPGVWRTAVEVAKGPEPDEPLTFIHRDFHPGNVLWSGARPSSIVDWLHGCWGSPSVDLAHCRINLWLDHGPAAAERLLNAYRQIRPDLEDFNPYWDIVDALGWIPKPKRDGLTRVRRYESFVTAAVRSLDSR